MLLKRFDLKRLVKWCRLQSVLTFSFLIINQVLESLKHNNKVALEILKTHHLCQSLKMNPRPLGPITGDPPPPTFNHPRYACGRGNNS